MRFEDFFNLFLSSIPYVLENLVPCWTIAQININCVSLASALISYSASTDIPVSHHHKTWCSQHMYILPGALKGLPVDPNDRMWWWMYMHSYPLTGDSDLLQPGGKWRAVQQGLVWYKV